MKLEERSWKHRVETGFRRTGCELNHHHKHDINDDSGDEDAKKDDDHRNDE